MRTFPNQETGRFRLFLVGVLTASAVHHFGWWDGVGIGAAAFALYDALLERL